MKKLLFTVFFSYLAAPSAAEKPADLPCSLDQTDLQALARTRDQYDAEKILALPANDKVQLCKSRELLRRFRQRGAALAQELTLDDIPQRMSRFVPPDEYEQVGPIVRKVINDNWGKGAR